MPQFGAEPKTTVWGWRVDAGLGCWSGDRGRVFWRRLLKRAGASIVSNCELLLLCHPLSGAPPHPLFIQGEQLGLLSGTCLALDCWGWRAGCRLYSGGRRRLAGHPGMFPPVAGWPPHHNNAQSMVLSQVKSAITTNSRK